MQSHHLRDAINELIAWKDGSADEKLAEALALLERAHGALDKLEDEKQDLEDSAPNAWERGVLAALDKMPADQLGPYLEAGKAAAAEAHGMTSPEYESIEMLTTAILAPPTVYK